jgi:hypothetical protein
MLGEGGGAKVERGECMYSIVMSSFFSRVMHVRIVLENGIATLKLPFMCLISKHVLCLEILELFLNGRLKC